MSPALPQVVLVGRINAGKSTLFNRLTESGSAIVSDIAGTTRDVQYSPITWRDTTFALVDTGGLDAAQLGIIEQHVQRRAYQAVADAQLIVYVLDGIGDPSPEDRRIIKDLRKQETPLILAVTKLDGPKKRRSVSDKIYGLGIQDIIFVSGVSGAGTGDLLDYIVQRIPAAKDTTRDSDITVSIIGKTNVGKSSIFNAILGEERVIVTPHEHTTREPQDTQLVYYGTPLTLVDTAGLRKRRQASGALEKKSAAKTETMISRSDISWIVTDVSQPLSSQDLTIAQLARDSKNGIIIVANKWDLVPDKDTSTMEAFTKTYRHYFSALQWAPILFTSATDKQRLGKLLKTTVDIHAARGREISQKQLNSLLASHAPRKAAPRKGTKSATDVRLMQTGTFPPTFTIFARHTERLHPAYASYIENALRKTYNLSGTPLSVNIEPYR